MAIVGELEAACVPTPVASGEDEDTDDIVELADKLLRACVERGVDTLDQLKNMLSGGPDEYDWMPPGLRDQAARDQLDALGESLPSRCFTPDPRP